MVENVLKFISSQQYCYFLCTFVQILRRPWFLVNRIPGFDIVHLLKDVWSKVLDFYLCRGDDLKRPIFMQSQTWYPIMVCTVLNMVVSHVSYGAIHGHRTYVFCRNMVAVAQCTLPTVRSGGILLPTLTFTVKRMV